MIKEKVISHLFFKAKGNIRTEFKDEYGVEIFRKSSDSNIFLKDFSSKVIMEDFEKMRKDFKIHKYKSYLEVKFSINFNRGFPLERYFLKTIPKCEFYEADPKRSTAFAIPATHYMYHVISLIITAILHALSFGKLTKENVRAKKDKIGGFLLIMVLKKVKRTSTFRKNQGKNHVIFSTIFCDFLNGRDDKIKDNAIIVTNNSDSNFDFRKDVVLVCCLNFKLLKYASDNNAFERPLLSREYLTCFVGKVFDMRVDLFNKRTKDCNWVDHHVSFKQYAEIYSNSKFYLQLPGDEEWSPRLFEGMFFGAIPVILFKDSKLPFSDILDWSTFSILVPVENWEKTYDIIRTIDDEKYFSLKKNLRTALKHFCYHQKPLLGDAFYMTLYSIWRRLEKNTVN